MSPQTPESTNQPGEEPDRLEMALEEGDPTFTGRSRGRIIDEKTGLPAGNPDEPAPDFDDSTEDWESGRQDAM